MTLSLRSRLTGWYSVLLVLTLAVFSALVLWLNWQQVLEGFDESLEATSATADNVMREEARELKDLSRAAAEMTEVVHPKDIVVAVLDDRGVPLAPGSTELPLPGESKSWLSGARTRSIQGPSGRLWRVTLRRGEAEGKRYVIAVGAPLDEPLDAWHELVKACAFGIPLAVAFAIWGGWWIGRRGLRPLEQMVGESRAITARTPDTRLTVPRAIPELEQLAGSFNVVLERLGSALSTQRRFMADASHELRTPVSIMRTAAEVTLGRPDREDAEYRDALAVVAQQASRLARLVDDMLVLARADGTAYPVHASRVDLAALVAEAVQDLRPHAVEKQIEVTTSLAFAEVTADETLLRRMVVNLVANALTYTPAGGFVDIALVRDTANFVLRVTDTGAGIPLADRERVFERFVRLDPARSAGGAGLGLSIARWVAEAHKGTLQIDTSGPEGTVFVARLPA